MSTQTLTPAITRPDSGLLTRAAIAAYALAAYAVGTGALFWVLLAAAGLAPHGLTDMQVGNPVAAIVINIGLIVAFAVQHTVMARTWFKQAVQTIIPQPIERSTYVLAAGIAMAALVYFWQTVPGGHLDCAGAVGGCSVTRPVLRRCRVCAGHVVHHQPF